MPLYPDTRPKLPPPAAPPPPPPSPTDNRAGHDPPTAGVPSPPPSAGTGGTGGTDPRIVIESLSDEHAVGFAVVQVARGRVVVESAGTEVEVVADGAGGLEVRLVRGVVGRR